MARKTGRIFGIVLGCFIMCILIASINLVTYAEEAPAPEPELVCSICGKSPGMHPIIIPEWHDCSDPNCCECYGHTVAQIDGVLMCTRCSKPACHFGYEYSLVCSGDHSYSNGFCTACDAYEPAVLNGDVYEISNAGQLYWFAAQVNNGNNAINGKLMDNIVVNENVLNESGWLNDGDFRKWDAIGYYESDTDKVEYAGIFDGNGKTVAGLYNKWGTESYYGMFSIVGNQGAVKNVGVVDSYLSGGSNFGSVVGYNYGTVINCYNTGYIKPYGNCIGGVVGYNAGTVDGCYNLVNVSGYGGDWDLGGVVGSNSGLVINCYNTGCVTGGSYHNVGGVVGYSSGTISGCYNTGSVEGSYHTGGITGISKYEIKDCYNRGSVSGGTYTGGIAGENYFGDIIGCYNTGTVTGSDDVGGIVGYNDSYVYKCYNTGNVGCIGDYCSDHGGIAGNSSYSGSYVGSCYSIGDVSGEICVGGVVGSAGSTTVTNCYATGSISGSYSVGGVVGSGTPSNCYYLVGSAVDEDGTVQFGVGSYSTGDSEADVAGCTTGMTAEQFTSGEVCYLLQGEQTEQIWGQLIGTDAYPVFSDDKVYLRGDQYSNSDACVHDYTYSFSNSLHTLTCSICDDVQTVNGNNAFSVPYTAVTLGTHIDLQFKAYVDDCFSDVCMVFTVEDSNGEIVETLYPDYKVDATGRWVYTYEGVNPQLMSDTVHATMYGCLNGNLVEVHKSQSVENYCKAVLCMDTVVDAKIRTLVSDLLIYGAMSQKFKGYDVDNLVTDGAVNLTPSVFPGVDGVVGYNSFDDSLVKENTVHDVTRFSMRLSNKVSLKMYMVLDNPELYTYQVSVNGATFNYDASDLTYDASQNRYYLLFDLMAYEMDAPVSLVILRDGEQVSRKMTCSATGYIKEHGVGEGALIDLLQALYNYGKSAEAM